MPIFDPAFVDFLSRFGFPALVAIALGAFLYFKVWPLVITQIENNKNEKAKDRQERQQAQENLLKERDRYIQMMDQREKKFSTTMDTSRAEFLRALESRDAAFQPVVVAIEQIKDFMKDTNESLKETMAGQNSIVEVQNRILQQQIATQNDYVSGQKMIAATLEAQALAIRALAPKEKTKRVNKDV
jgi:hypothetical protein